MLFGRRNDLHEGHAIALLRDVIEIVAIVAAGIWAFYVFAYENRIKPSMADPDVGLQLGVRDAPRRPVNGTRNDAGSGNHDRVTSLDVR